MSSDDEQNWVDDDEGSQSGVDADANVAHGPDMQQQQQQEQQQEQEQIDLEENACTPTSILDLILAQKSNGVDGVRLSVHNEIATNLTMEDAPFFTCALQGLSHLAAVLYHRGIPRDQNLSVVSFSARGSRDRTPWQKTITVSPSEAALLAGFAETSQVLQQIESGVPIHWTPQNHAACPLDFRQKVRAVMEALCTSQLFVALPGPARMEIVQQTISSMSQIHLWPSVSSESGLWGGPCIIPPEQAAAWESAQTLTTKHNTVNADDGEERTVLSFRMAIVRLSRARRIARFMSRLTAGGAAVQLSRSLGCFSIIPTAGIFCAAFLSPIPAVLVISSLRLHQLLAKPQVPGS